MSFTKYFEFFLFQASSGGNGSSDSPLISKEPSPGPRRRKSEDSDDLDDEDEAQNGSEEDTPEHEMEYCDPCYCYGKCCLDIVASIFCVSLL